MTYADMKECFAASAFRSRFRLSPAERAYVAEKGFTNIRAQAEKIVRERLAPAHPAADGRQTPMRGHAVFKAQHATACCCRSCLQKWHGIPVGRALDEAEIACVVDMLMGWIADHAGNLADLPHTPELFAACGGNDER